MPPKTKAMTNKKQEKQDLAKSDKRPTAKGRKKIRIKSAITRDTLQEYIVRESYATDQINMEGIAEETTNVIKTLSDEIPLKEDSDSDSASKENRLEKMLEQLALEDSSSESEKDDEAFYNKTQQKAVEANAEMLLGSTHSVSELEAAAEAEEAIEAISSDEDLPEYLKQKDLEEPEDFFGNIGDVPDVEELSIDVSVEKLKIKEKHKPKPRGRGRGRGRGDTGQFVDPVTGKIMYTQESEEEEEIKIVVKKPKRVVDEPVMIDGRVVKEVKILLPESDDEISIDILSDQEQEDEALPTEEVDVEDIFNQFLITETPSPVIVFEEIDVEALFSEENARILRIQTYEFVQYLIDMAVEEAEYVDQTVILGQNLDKRKLITELYEKLQVLEFERRNKLFLNRKSVEYYRRKRTYRPILPDNPRTMHMQYQKYEAALTRLDELLLKEDEAKTISKKSLEVAQAHIIVENARSQEKVKELEELISTTLSREHYDNLQQFVASTLNQMQLMRKEISDNVFEMIEKQHDLVILKEQLRNLENLGEGLNMRDYESLQTEIQSLGKKIEERNTELTKLRVRSQRDILRMAHLKEKQSILRVDIVYQRQHIDRLELDKENLREFLHRLKIERNYLRKAIRETSYQSGLLDKPDLLKDYDTTIEYLAVLKSRVEDYHATLKTLDAKIKFLEKHYNND